MNIQSFVFSYKQWCHMYIIYSTRTSIQEMQLPSHGINTFFHFCRHCFSVVGFPSAASRTLEELLLFQILLHTSSSYAFIPSHAYGAYNKISFFTFVILYYEWSYHLCICCSSASSMATNSWIFPVFLSSCCFCLRF